MLLPPPRSDLLLYKAVLTYIFKTKIPAVTIYMYVLFFFSPKFSKEKNRRRRPSLSKPYNVIQCHTDTYLTSPPYADWHTHHIRNAAKPVLRVSYLLSTFHKHFFYVKKKARNQTKPSQVLPKARRYQR